MDDGEARIECLKHLSNISRSQFDIRQKVEWRVVLMALTFYVLSVVGVHQYSLPFGTDATLLLVVYVVFTSIVVMWLFRVHMNHAINKNAAHKAEDELWRAAGMDPPFEPKSFLSSLYAFYRVDEEFKSTAGKGTIYCTLQILMVLFFMMASWWLATSEVSTTSQPKRGALAASPVLQQNAISHQLPLLDGSGEFILLTLTTGMIFYYSGVLNKVLAKSRKAELQGRNDELGRAKRLKNSLLLATGFLVFDASIVLIRIILHFFRIADFWLDLSIIGFFAAAHLCLVFAFYLSYIKKWSISPRESK